MSQPLRMHQIRRIIELQNEGRSIRETERLTGLSRNTIREYLRRISVSGLTYSQLSSLNDETLIPIVYVEDIERNQSGRSTDERYTSFERQVEYFTSELRKRGVTRHLLWEEYRKHPLNYTLPGNNSVNLFTGWVGIFSSVARSHSKGLTPLILQVPRKEYNMAALLAPLCDPANK